ncbi:membrane protein [Allostella vacuolata]|nr:membrane protein [Stella vacuolata]
MTAAWLKILHIAALSTWCAGLLVLPGVIAPLGRMVRRDEWEAPAARQLRSFARACYLAVASPAAVLTIGSGMALIFQREAFAPWLFAKLLLVGGMALVHMQCGRVIVGLAKPDGRAPRLLPPVLLTVAGVLILGVLWLVLAKPVIDSTLFPDWLRRPRPAQSGDGQSSFSSIMPI